MHGPGQADAILHLDNSRALRDAANRAVEHPVEQDARDLAGERGISDVGRLRSASAAARPAAVNVTGGGNQPAGPAGIGSLPALIAAAWLIGTSPARPPGGIARTCCSCAQSPARFGLPFGSRKGRFVRSTDSRRSTADSARASAHCQRHRLHSARSRILAMRVARNLDGRARHEHLRRPAGASEHRGRPHLAFHRDDLTVAADDIEIDIRMRVDEVEPCQPALELAFFLNRRGRRRGARRPVRRAPVS